VSKSVIIFGCGFVGMELARRCLELGWSVSALTRNPQKVAEAKDLGLYTVQGNLHESGWWDELPGNFDHVVNCVGAASPSIDGYRDSYLKGMHSVLGWIKQNGSQVNNLVFTSSSSVYPQTDGSLVNEKSDTSGASDRGQILVNAEQACLHASAELARRRSVIRFSGLYGPGRHLLVDKIRRGDPMSGCPQRILNLIHRDDAASALLAILEAEDSVDGGIFNACDGQHATRGEIANWVAGRVGVQAPEFIGAPEDHGPNRCVENSKIKKVFGWVPRFADFQTGYEDFLASE
jgi:nucleoside-diphosphate-sugar epimerase